MPKRITVTAADRDLGVCRLRIEASTAAKDDRLSRANILRTKADILERQTAKLQFVNDR